MKRIHYIDIARAIAMFIIVFGHTIVYSVHCTNIYKVLYSFNVVLFFIISGMTFNNKNKTFFSFIKNKFMRIMIPYFIWALLFIIPFLLFGKNVQSSSNVTASFQLKDCIIDVLYGTAFDNHLKQNASLWFLPALFFTNVLVFALSSFLDKFKVKNKYILCLTLLISIMSIVLVKKPLPLGLSTSLHMIFFFYIGYILKKYDIFSKYNNWLLIALFIVIGVTFAIINGQVGVVNLKYSNVLYFLISSFTISYAIIAISNRINYNSILEYVGKNTMSILIFHKIIILVFQTKLGKITKVLLNSNIVFELLIAFTISVISIVFCLIISLVFEKTFPSFIGKSKIQH